MPTLRVYTDCPQLHESGNGDDNSGAEAVLVVESSPMPSSSPTPPLSPVPSPVPSLGLPYDYGDYGGGGGSDGGDGGDDGDDGDDAAPPQVSGAFCATALLAVEEGEEGTYWIVVDGAEDESEGAFELRVGAKNWRRSRRFLLLQKLLFRIIYTHTPRHSFHHAFTIPLVLRRATSSLFVLAHDQVTCSGLPTPAPTNAPTGSPTIKPTHSQAPTVTSQPSEAPVLAPTPAPSEAPSPSPTTVPARSNCACFSAKMVENLHRHCPSVAHRFVEGCMINVTRAVLEEVSGNCSALKADWGPFFGNPVQGYPNYD